MLRFSIFRINSKSDARAGPGAGIAFALQGALPPRCILKLFFRSISGLFPIYFQKSRLYFTFFLK